jgi:tRNA(Ile2)-agmatinylcytidine synthase
MSSKKDAYLYVGIDDTDSPRGMCTTYVGAVALKKIEAIGGLCVGYPKLVRLNPCWPKKTRGNCAVAFLVKTVAELVPEVKETVLQTVEELAEKDERTNPGVAFFHGVRPFKKLVDLSRKAVRDIVEFSEAEKLAAEPELDVYKFKSGDGIVGALAAIGHPMDEDFTYELIAYRIPKNRGKPRRVDPESVFDMDAKTRPLTFDNVDPWTGEVRITPHTPCPVLYGIRGETPEILEYARELVKTEEPVEHVQIFKTNQGTDEHLVSARIAEIKPLRSYSVRAEVISEPRVIQGGHVFFRIRDPTGEIWCAAYEPTRVFRSIVKQLVPGDEVVVHGGVKLKDGLPLTLNLEKIEILKLVSKRVKRNPRCPECGKRMKSAGHHKGYICKRCKRRAPEDAVEEVEVPRSLKAGKFEVPPRARRHLARPLQRELSVKTALVI